MSLKFHLVLAFCLLGAALCSDDGRASYDNYRVYKVIPSSVEELAVLKELESATDSMMFLDGIHRVGQDVKVVVAPHKIPDFLQLMGTNEIEYELLERDLQSKLESDEIKVAPRSRAVSDYGWTEYHELLDTYDWLTSLVQKYPHQVTLIEGGRTYEQRPILGVKISSKEGNPGIFLEAGIHAREWIASTTATYIINQLLTSTYDSIKNLAQNYDWYIFPHANPDGYVYTHTTDRIWRKTRQPYGTCFGADPNRNWGFHWNEVGASNEPCSETYAGPYAFSEIETLSLSNYIASLKGKIQLYISFHAYAQLLLYPYGHSNELPPNIDDYRSVFDVATAAVDKRYGTKFAGGNMYDTFYPAAGGSVDWAYANVGTQMAFSYELRPGSSSMIGFRLAADQIIPTGEEVVDSITAMVGEVKRLGYFDEKKLFMTIKRQTNV